MGSSQINPKTVLFLHGFWGQSSNWNFLKNSKFSKPFLALDYTKDTLLGPQHFLSDWGQNFIIWKRALFGNHKISAVGYSQGGRLLLQALAAAPEDFEKVILVSSHPGLKSFSEKEERLNHDRKWAQKFRTEDWSKLQTEWNSQTVFQSKLNELKLESDFSRESLALCFENWSLAHQSDFRELINLYSDKVNIVLGGEDSKYVQMYQEFLRKMSTLKMEKGAAHRVPSDQPKMLVETLNSIILKS